MRGQATAALSLSRAARRLVVGSDGRKNALCAADQACWGVAGEPYWSPNKHAKLTNQPIILLTRAPPSCFVQLLPALAAPRQQQAQGAAGRGAAAFRARLAAGRAIGVGELRQRVQAQEQQLEQQKQQLELQCQQQGQRLEQQEHQLQWQEQQILDSTRRIAMLEVAQGRQACTRAEQNQEHC